MTYYVTHPNLDFSAKVDAPSTEKARTTFLDYLERNGVISRRRRQYVRENMVAEKLEHPETVDADIELSYGYRAEEGPAYQLGGREEYYERGEVPPSREMVEIPLDEEGRAVEPELEVEEPERPSGVTPIARAATRGYV